MRSRMRAVTSGFTLGERAARGRRRGDRSNDARTS